MEARLDVPLRSRSFLCSTLMATAAAELHVVRQVDHAHAACTASAYPNPCRRDPGASDIGKKCADQHGRISSFEPPAGRGRQESAAYRRRPDSPARSTARCLLLTACC